MHDFYRLQFGAIWNYFRNEKAYFWFLCAYLFLEYVRPQTIWRQLDILPFAQITLILTAAGFLLSARRGKQHNVVNGLLILFLLVAVVSSVTAYIPQEAYGRLSVVFSWVIIYFLIVKVVDSEKRLFIFLLLYFLVNLKMSQHGFRSWMSAGFGFRAWGVACGPGGFNNSGECGTEMAIFVPIAICFIVPLWVYWEKWKRALLLTLPVTGFATIIASSSRGAVVAGIAALIWLAISGKHRLRMLTLAVAVILGSYQVMSDDFKERFLSAGDDQTSQQRLTYWRHGIEMIHQFPVIGIGYGNWLKYYSYRFPNDVPFQGVELPHNIYIHVGAEMGLIGLAAYLLLIGASFRNNYRTRQVAQQLGHSYLYWAARGFDAATIAFLVSGMFVTITYYPFFWINLAFTVALNNIAVQALNQRTVSRENYDAVPGNGTLETANNGSVAPHVHWHKKIS